MLSEKVALGVLYLVLVCVLVVIICVQVGDEQDSHAVEKYSISGGKAVRFHVLGDFGDLKQADPPVEEVALAMSSRASTYPIDFVAATGNDRYSSGVVDEFDQTIYKLMYHVFHKAGLVGKPWYLTLGSIDCESDPQLQVEMTKLYSMWNMPSLYYNFSLSLDGDKQALFIFLDSCTLACQDNFTMPGYCEDYYNSTTAAQIETQYDWLYNVSKYFDNIDDSVLWRFVFLGISPFSASSGDADNESLKIHLIPKLLDYKVDVLFTGHDTLMQYFYLDRLDPPNYEALNYDLSYSCFNDSYAPFGDVMHSQRGDALHEFAMGASGAPLDSLCPNKTTPMASLVYGDVSHGFLEVTVSSTEVVVNFLQVGSLEPVFNITILA